MGRLRTRGQRNRVTEHIVKLTLAQPVETHEEDFQGRIIEGERALRRFAMMTCEIASSDFQVATALKASLPKERVPETDDIADFLACCTRLVIPRYFAIHTIELFSLHDIWLLDYFDDGLPELSEARHTYSMETECHLSSEVYGRLSVQASEYDTAKKAFESAVEKLTDYSGMTPSGLVSYATDIHRQLRFLDECRDSAYPRQATGLFSGKHRLIKEYFSDLARRKNAAHPNYLREQQCIQQSLYSYSAPKCWLSAPPHAVESSE